MIEYGQPPKIPWKEVSLIIGFFSITKHCAEKKHLSRIEYVIDQVLFRQGMIPEAKDDIVMLRFLSDSACSQ